MGHLCRHCSVCRLKRTCRRPGTPRACGRRPRGHATMQARCRHSTKIGGGAVESRVDSRIPDVTTTAPTTTTPRRRWLQFSLRTMLVLMVVVGCGFGWFLAIRRVNAAAEESDEPESPARARLELRATGARRNPVLVVTLRNISDTPIVVDRELLFALWLKARLSTGDYVGPTVVRREEPPKRDAAEWERRFRRLAPARR